MKMKRISAQQAACLLASNDNILILTHRNPDGDTLGSGFALMHALISLGKKAKVVCGDEIPSKYNYMFSGKSEIEFHEEYVVAVDVADSKLLGDNLNAQYGEKVDLCIDHHLSNNGFAENLIFEERAATCEIIYDIIKLLGAEITKPVADCLYTGISTDTGCFMFSNVTPSTHIIAADLIEKGADYVEINKVMFETKSLGYFELEKLALDTIETLYGGKCAVMKITQKMLSKSGTTESDCDGIAGIPRKIDGVLVGVTIRERDDGTYKVSLRSHAPVDSAAICAVLGGGGHARAAGCEINPDKYEAEKNQLLETIRKELEKV